MPPTSKVMAKRREDVRAVEVDAAAAVNRVEP